VFIIDVRPLYLIFAAIDFIQLDIDEINKGKYDVSMVQFHSSICSGGTSKSLPIEMSKQGLFKKKSTSSDTISILAEEQVEALSADEQNCYNCYIVLQDLHKILFSAGANPRSPSFK
jgi:hypothetical protein